ncbi:Imm50 family immunity protein [Streptomyces sp. NPDC101166]|uniref:Imm50 family immunity protein n=1 Tax=Streptomyces sp. NPDC101166 TaxID=3366120 RepID=UPI0037FD57F5
MTVDELIINPDALHSIYGAAPVLGDVVRVRSININWRGPTVTLRVDLPYFPEAAPQSWLDASLDTVQCHLQFLAVENMTIQAWEPPATARIEAAPQRDRGSVHIRAKSDTIDLAFECSDSVVIGHLSAFRIHSDGSDSGPRSFLSRLDALRHSSLPETCEKTYYEHA